jgi:hypothetical protein
MLYKTLYLKGNPYAEYQKRNGVWYKRAIGSSESWYRVDAKGSDIMNNAYQNKNEIYFYSNLVVYGGVALIGVLGYLAYKKYGNRMSPKL